ncbi:hypothetical protein MalM25_02120 [Planctomycetes bacterium MalM25]|nr:hypothetical protein MalM25_02120 [Planctomycetes bacterium MalM25]
MDPLRFAIAAVPLAAYLVLLGLINLRRRPTVVSGASDVATLGLALTGLVMIGPISLFWPEHASESLGDFVWLFLLAFYWLWVVLIVMLGRPRLVIYNLTAEELRPVLSEASRRIDPSGRWAGDNLSLPSVGVQAHLDCLAWMRNTSLVSSGGRQDLAGWRRLGRTVERSLRDTETPPSSRGASLLGVGVGLLVMSVARLVSDPPAVLAAWQQIIAG